MTDTQFPTKNFLQSATHFARKTSRIKQKPLAFGRLKKPPSIVDMSYYVTNENSFLDIKNAHLRVTGNVHTDVLKVGSIGFQPTGSNIPGTVNFTNVTTGVTTSSNLDVGGTLNLGTVELSASTHTLDHITARGNVTSTTVQFDNATTGLVTTANVEVGGELTVSSNIEVAGFVGTSGTGGLTVPSGTTGEQPTGVVGMIRFNSTVNRLEVYNGTAWQSIGGVSATQSASSGTTANSGGYKIHTFTASGSLTVLSGGEVDYLVVAGGGGGGKNAGSGGGAGGMLTGQVTLAAGAYNITVGTGGAGGSSSSAYGTKGNDSLIVEATSPPTSIVAASGGGYGVNVGNGGSGGSGGGGSDGENGIASGGSGMSGQGNNGGNGNHPGGTGRAAGGGGGAGAVGQNSQSSSKGGAGGTGVISTIRELGNVYYAGGGGGACHNTATGGSGGTGGGGKGGNSGGPGNGNPGTSGTINTGGGGGGGAGHGYDGANGGSGIVVIRYLQ